VPRVFTSENHLQVFTSENHLQVFRVADPCETGELIVYLVVRDRLPVIPEPDTP